MKVSSSQVILDESMFGYDRTAIGFPNLLLCMGFVLRSNVGLWGVHLDAMDYSASIISKFWIWCADKGLKSGDITDVFGVCNFAHRYGKGDQNLAEWKREMRFLAKACNFTGPAHGFDTGVVVGPQKKAAYIEYVENFGGNRNCKIYYKKFSKVDRTEFKFQISAAKTDDVVLFSGGEIASHVSRAMGYAGRTNDSHKGTFHDVDSLESKINYRVRMHTIHCPA